MVNYSDYQIDKLIKGDSNESPLMHITISIGFKSGHCRFCADGQKLLLFHS